MPIHGRDGGSWRDIYAPSARAAGVWESGSSTTDGVNAVYCKTGGAWRMAWPLLISTTNPTVADTNLGGTASATVQLLTDGRFAEFGANTSTTYENWAENQPNTDKGGATLFQFRWVQGTGNTTPTTVNAGTENTWQDLTADVEWTITQSTSGGPDLVRNIDIDVRAKDATDSVLSVTASLNTFTFAL